MDRACGTQGQNKNAYWVLVGRPKERDHLEDLSVDKGTTFQGILKKCGVA